MAAKKKTKPTAKKPIPSPKKSKEASPPKAEKVLDASAEKVPGADDAEHNPEITSQPPEGDSSPEEGAKFWKRPPVESVGRPIRVRFSALRHQGNIREILPTAAEVEELAASIKASGLQERLTVYKKEEHGRDCYVVQKGGTRFLALQRIGFDSAAWIDVLEVPAPKSRALDVAMQLAGNDNQRPLAWPDKARAIAIAAGHLTDDGRVRSVTAVRAGVAAGDFKAHKDLAAELQLDVSTIDLHARVGVVPYKMLQVLFDVQRRRGTQNPSQGIGVADVFAKYPAGERAKQLAHYEAQGAFKADEPPPRLRAEGGGRKPAAAKIGPMNPAPPKQAEQRDLFRDTSPGPLEVASRGEPITPPAASAQEPIEAGSIDDQQHVRAMTLADHFGLGSPAMVRLLDAAALHWRAAAHLAMREGPMTDAEAEPLNRMLEECRLFAAAEDA